MAVSRPILLALIAAILALVGFYATMGARSSGEEPSAPAKAAPEPAPTPPKADQKRPAGPSASRSATRPTRPNATRDPGARTRPGLPADVARSLARGRTVVLFFFQRGGADDAATAKAVAAVRRRGQAKVVQSPISRLGHYRAVTAGTGISQAPAVLILRKDRGQAQTAGAPGGAISARLVEGFVDQETLLQQVADTR